MHQLIVDVNVSYRTQSTLYIFRLAATVEVTWC